MLDRIKSIVLDSVPSLHSKAAYDRSLTYFFAWYATSSHDGLSKATVQRWAESLRNQGLAPSTFNLRLSAVRKLVLEAADNGAISLPVAEAIKRVKGVKRSGVRSGNWLTISQSERVLNAPSMCTLKGKRDRAILAVLAGCGMRRTELSVLTFDRIQQREGRWAIMDIRGKGGRIRSIPMPSWAKHRIDIWAEAAGVSDGLVFRALNNRHQLTGLPLQPQNVRDIVTRYGKQCGRARLAPHDLRRTYARLARDGGASLEQIQVNLGHQSIATTESYIGAKLSFSDAPCDRLGIVLDRT